MCRLFAVHADRPVNALSALLTAPHALIHQSCGDRSGECHPNGWGIGHYANGKPVRVRSTAEAQSDPLYPTAARAADGRTILGHVRQASVGRVSEANTHPFVHGNWMFAHNGTVEGFADDPAPLLDLIPARRRGSIEGETDSEHLFQALLGRIDALDRIDGEAVAAIVKKFLGEIAQIYSGREEPTRLNIVLTDGNMLIASRWKHTLSLHVLGDSNEVIEASDRGRVRGVAIASEPVSPDGWRELPDPSILLVQADGSHEVFTG